MSFFLSQIENLEDLLKEKDNQLELARSKLNAVQAQTYTSEGTLTSLEEALTDRDKQGRDSVPIPELPFCQNYYSSYIYFSFEISCSLNTSKTH